MTHIAIQEQLDGKGSIGDSPVVSSDRAGNIFITVFPSDEQYHG